MWRFHARDRKIVMQKDKVMKNILILSSSPRKGGNTDILCDAFAKGAKEVYFTNLKGR